MYDFLSDEYGKVTRNVPYYDITSLLDVKFSA